MTNLIFALLTAFEIGMALMNIPPALDVFLNVYGVDYVSISILITSLLWTHSLVMVPGGVLADRMGVRRSMTAALALIALGNLLPLFQVHFGSAVFGRLTAGIGTGLGFIVNMKLIAVGTPKERAGRYQAYMGGVLSLGSILTFLLLPGLTRLNWRWAYLVPGVFSLMLLALTPVLKLPEREEASAQIALKQLKGVLSVEAGWVLGLLHALSWGSMITLGNWMPSMLSEAAGASDSADYVWGGALIMFVCGVGRISGGVMLSRLSPYRLARGAMAVLCVSYLGLWLTRAPVAVVALAVTAAWFSSVNFGAIFDLGARAASPNSLGGLYGFINFLANLGAFFFTFLLGWFKSATGSFSWAFPVLAGFCLFAFWLGGVISPLQENGNRR